MKAQSMEAENLRNEKESEEAHARDIETFVCKTCGARVVIGDGAVKFPCPYCDELIVRCARCRKLGREYVSECGFRGP